MENRLFDITESVKKLPGGFLYPYPNGCSYNGVNYSAHALERMLPDTAEMRDLVESRVKLRAIRFGPMKETPQWDLYLQYHEPHLRAVVPEEVENVLWHGKVEKEDGKTVTIALNGLNVVFSTDDVVITVYRASSEPRAFVDKYKKFTQPPINCLEIPAKGKRGYYSMYHYIIRFKSLTVRFPPLKKLFRSLMRKYQAIKTIRRNVRREQAYRRFSQSLYRPAPYRDFLNTEYLFFLKSDVLPRRIGVRESTMRFLHKILLRRKRYHLKVLNRLTRRRFRRPKKRVQKKARKVRLFSPIKIQRGRSDCIIPDQRTKDGKGKKGRKEINSMESKKTQNKSFNDEKQAKKKGKKGQRKALQNEKQAKKKGKKGQSKALQNEKQAKKKGKKGQN